MNEYFYICKLKNLIEEKLKWGNKEDWTNSYYEILSIQIQESTGVLISVLTLKRLFGKVRTKKSYNPHIGTKKALVQFLGYKNWGSFVQEFSKEMTEERELDYEKEDSNLSIDKIFSVENEHNRVLQEQQVAKRFSKLNFKYAYILPIILILSGISIVSFLIYEQSLNNLVLDGKELVGPVPLYSAIYYDASKSNYKNIHLEYLEVGGQNYELPKNEHYYTQTFKIPDFYRLKLIGDGKEIKTFNVHALSEGWRAVYIAQHDQFEIIPDSIVQKDSGKLYVSPESLKSNGFKIDQDYWIAYKHIKDFQLSGDNFTLTTRIKNDVREGGKECFDIHIEILGEGAKANIMFVKPNATKFLKFKFSDKSFNGMFQNLDNFGKDFQDWRQIKLEVKNKNVVISFEDEIVENFNYTESIGNIKGIVVNFKGSGSIQNVTLNDPLEKDKVVYFDNFDSSLNKETNILYTNR